MIFLSRSICLRITSGSFDIFTIALYRAPITAESILSIPLDIAPVILPSSTGKNSLNVSCKILKSRLIALSSVLDILLLATS